MDITDDDASYSISKIDFSAKVTGGFILASGGFFAYYRFDDTIQTDPIRQSWFKFTGVLRNQTPLQQGIRNISQYEAERVFILVDVERWVFDLNTLETTRLDIVTDGTVETLHYLESSS